MASSPPPPRYLQSVVRHLWEGRGTRFAFGLNLAFQVLALVVNTALVIVQFMLVAQSANGLWARDDNLDRVLISVVAHTELAIVLVFIALAMVLPVAANAMHMFNSTRMFRQLPHGTALVVSGRLLTLAARFRLIPLARYWNMDGFRRWSTLVFRLTAHPAGRMLLLMFSIFVNALVPLSLYVRLLSLSDASRTPLGQWGATELLNFTVFFLNLLYFFSVRQFGPAEFIALHESGSDYTSESCDTSTVAIFRATRMWTRAIGETLGPERGFALALGRLDHHQHAAYLLAEEMHNPRRRVSFKTDENEHGHTVSELAAHHWKVAVTFIPASLVGAVVLGLLIITDVYKSPFAALQQVGGGAS